MINIIFMIVFAMGTISSTANAARTNSFSSMLFWNLVGVLELIATILQVIQIVI